MWSLLKKLTTELLYDPVVPLLDIYLEKTITLKDICTLMFIATLFTIARTWKQPKCPSTEKWIKKMWYMHPRNYYSAIKENERMLFTATWRQLEIIMLSEVSQTVQFSCSVMSDSL